VLDKCLFTSYTLNVGDSPGEEQPDVPSFQINLSFLLETLQILGTLDVANRGMKSDQDGYRGPLRTYRPDAFSNQALGLPGTCCLTYAEVGAPFSITIEESGVKTTANIVTYTPEIQDSIPFDRTDLAFKIIMHPRSLLDALSDLSTMGPRKLHIQVTRAQPYLALAGKGGDYGSTSYDFAKARDLLESIAVHDDRWSENYKFDMIKVAGEAMRIAHKVSFRGDRQGVLSLQFIVEVETAGSSFLEFAFVPFVGSGDDQDDDDLGAGDEDYQG
jgi:cell cycle checkpoint protein